MIDAMRPFNTLVVETAINLCVGELSKRDKELLAEVKRWAEETGASEERVIEEITATLEPDRPVSGGPTMGRGITFADIQYHGAAINE